MHLEHLVHNLIEEGKILPPHHSQLNMNNGLPLEREPPLQLTDGNFSGYPIRELIPMSILQP